MDLDKQCSNNCDVTHVKVKEFVYTWVITNFKFYHCKLGEKLQSPIFTTGDNNEFEWRLNLYASGYNEQSKDYLSVYLELLKSAPKKIVYLILSLVNRIGEESDVSVEALIDIKFQNFEKRRFYKFAERSYVLDKNNALLSNGGLTIRCKMYFTDGIVHCSHPTSIFLPADQTLSNDFERLLENEKFSDVKLLVGDKKLSAHRNVLSARSHVFAAMFESNTESSENSVVNITDIEQDVMQEVLRFIYTGKVSEVAASSGDLLVAADKYQLEGLKVLCQDALIVNLSLINVGEVLNLADRHKAEELKKAAMEFIANHAKVLADSEKFRADMTSLSPLLAEMLNVFMLKQ